ncbi:hypothetical protein [Sulfitobacter sp. MF3-043]|uniref:hypothetical protein n=1 Tax=Sulfitobacter sediminivivens TaxID=3252902 RepID=UPI0036D8D339
MAKQALNSQPKERIAVLGLGDVGLPLVLAVPSAGFEVAGLDTHAPTIATFKDGHNPSNEVSDIPVATSAARFSSGPERANPCDADHSISDVVHDPWVGSVRLTHVHGVNAVDRTQNGSYDPVIVAVGHRQYIEMGNDAIGALGKPGTVLYDIKGIFGKSGSDLRL